MKYYTYTHATPSGDVFYVGKGSGHRAYSTKTRPLAWRQKVAEHDGITIKIVSRFALEADAFSHEMALIEMHREAGAALLNLTSGGRGVLDYCQTEELRAYKRDLMTGYKHPKITCPHCGFVGGATSTKRWHFDRCKGLRPAFKARPTVHGARIYLGKYATKEEADRVSEQFKGRVAHMPLDAVYREALEVRQ